MSVVDHAIRVAQATYRDEGGQHEAAFLAGLAAFMKAAAADGHLSVGPPDEPAFRDNPESAAMWLVRAAQHPRVADFESLLDDPAQVEFAAAAARRVAGCDEKLIRRAFDVLDAHHATHGVAGTDPGR